MKKTLRYGISALMLAAALTAAQLPVYADDSGKSDDIVILYTNDIHCGIDTNIGFDGLALYKREMQTKYDNVLLVDAGDAIQGAPIGTLSKGAYITKLMNAAGYDVAVLGNHDFDYGMAELSLRADELNCGYVSANMYSLETNKLVFDPYKIVESGGKKIAFVGATTPETLLKSTPVFFQNDKGEYIYSFGEDGSLCDRLQDAIDGARAEGADHVILLSHLGENNITKGWSAPEVAAQLTGIDAIIDAHSHEVTPALPVKTKDGKEIIITQTGTKFANIGKMTISSDGTIKTELINSVPAPDDDMDIAEDSWLEPDDRAGRFVDEAVNRDIILIKDEFSVLLDEKIGHTDFDLIESDPVTGERLVRKSETNLGDLCADAYKVVLGADVAIVNGGGIRTSISAGDITYKDALSVFPFNNMVCTAEVTGQQILDILEAGAMMYPEESGSLIHASGICYSINTDIPSSVKLDETGAFIKVDGAYRVGNVTINDEPLDVKKTYVLAAHNYYLKNGGDGYILSGKCRIIKDEVMSDSDLISAYIRDDLGGVIPEKYREPYGEGRISITENSESTGPDLEVSTDCSECYVGDEFMVTITVRNTGDKALANVNVYFEDIPLNNTVTLDPKKEIQLSIKLQASESDIESGGIINISVSADELDEPVRKTCAVTVKPAAENTQEENPATGADAPAYAVMITALALAAVTAKGRTVKK